MGIANKKLSCFLLNFMLVAFLAVIFFGLPRTIGMEKNSDGMMSGCLFSGKVEICAMSFTEHITVWQSMFTTTATQNALTTVLLLLLTVVFVAVGIFKRSLLLLSSYHATRWRLYIRHNPELSLFNPLKEAFARGILNPKIY